MKSKHHSNNLTAKRFLATGIALITLTLAGCGSIASEHASELLGGNGSTVEASTKSDNTYKAYALSEARSFGTGRKLEQLDTEALLGIKIETSGSKVNWSTYSHQSNQKAKAGATLTNLNTKEKQTLEGTQGSIDASKLPDGVYSITVQFTDADTVAYFSKDAQGAHACRVTSLDYDIKNRDQLQKAMAKTKPEDNLSIKNLSWPSTLRENYHAADDLCELADSIVKEEWSDDLKVYAICDYIRMNWAFDQWYVNQGHGNHHNRCNDDWTNPKAFLPYTKVGVCADFTNALVIMFRHEGIPAAGIDNDSHMWAAIYLYDEWVTIDATKFVGKDCNKEDPDESKWTGHVTLMRQDMGYCDYKWDGKCVINSEEIRTYAN